MHETLYYTHKPLDTPETMYKKHRVLKASSSARKKCESSAL